MEPPTNDADDLKERLGAAWAAGRRPETCAILLEEVMPRVCRWLLSKFSISEEDAEDCFHDAVGGLLPREPSHVNNVYSYVFTSAQNKAIDLVHERGRLVHYDPDQDIGEESGLDDSPWESRGSLVDAKPDALVVLAEAALEEELTLREYQLQQIFTLTLIKLVPSRRRLTELLLIHGPRTGNDQLAEMMNISEGAIKSLKSRTLSDLRLLLPVAADALGFDFEHVLRPPPEGLFLPPVLPSEDNEEE